MAKSYTLKEKRKHYQDVIRFGYNPKCKSPNVSPGEQVAYAKGAVRTIDECCAITASKNATDEQKAAYSKKQAASTKDYKRKVLEEMNISQEIIEENDLLNKKIEQWPSRLKTSYRNLRNKNKNS